MFALYLFGLSAIMGVLTFWFCCTFVVCTRTETKPTSTMQDKSTKQVGGMKPVKGMEQVASMKRALTTVMRYTHRGVHQLDQLAAKVCYSLEIWESMREKFSDQEQVVIYEAIREAWTPRMKAVLNSFLDIYDASKRDHVELLAYLTHITQVDSYVLLPKHRPKLPGHHEASRLHALLKAIQQTIVNQELSGLATPVLADDHAFFDKLAATIIKLKKISYWLLTFYVGDEQRYMWNTLKTLLKPDLVGILSKFVESQNFESCEDQPLRVLQSLRTNDIQVDQALQVLQSLRTNDIQVDHTQNAFMI